MLAPTYTKIMNIITERPQKIIHKTQICAHELATVFQRYLEKIDILSLDCFDTLIWRKTAMPYDVFVNLQHKTHFQTLGISATLRAQHEAQARALKYISQGHSEVQLHDIYQHMLPQLNAAEIQSLVETEIAAEIDVCYAFSPVLELMRIAKQNHKKIIIVSDTYLASQQLTFLLSKKLPADVFKAVDYVFCSSEFKKSKSQGLFQSVLAVTHSLPERILHIGDHGTADFTAPKKLNIHALHFVHLDHSLEQLTGMRNWAATFMDPQIKQSRSALDPWQGMFACQDFTKNPEKIIGYATLGPIMYAFARYIAAEVEKVKIKDAQVKVLFLLRDGHLISKVCQTLYGSDYGKAVRISRFAACAASFRHKKDVESYLAEHVFSQRYAIICRQFLLPDNIAKPLIDKAERAQDSVAEFISLICQDAILAIIFSASEEYCNRLINYVTKTAEIASGDTLIFVDLGYRGTAQKKLAPIFLEKLGIKVIGRYLLALQENDNTCHAGLLDASWCDDRVLSMLVNYIALFEQVNTNTDSSVVDYDLNGTPILLDAEISSQQHEKLQAVQKNCLIFVKDALSYQEKSQLILDMAELRDNALADLTRFIFLPTQVEINYLQSFQFDFNLGTDKMMDVFNLANGVKDLRNRGLFFMEKNLDSMRTNYPAELRAASLELTFALMAQERFKGSLAIQQMSFRREKLSIILISNTQATRDELEAIPTFDGYYALTIPMGQGNFHVGVQFGEKYRWFEIFSAHLIQLSAYLTDAESEYTQDIQSQLVMNQIIERDKNLFECESSTALLAFIPTTKLAPKNHILRLVFRPIVLKQ